MKTFLRWWYRITGQKAAAEDLRRVAVILDEYPFTSPKRFVAMWHRDYGHIYDVYTPAPGDDSRTRRNPKRGA